jgi:hypothetical protein
MAFSFSPGQIAPQGSQAAVAPGTVAPGGAVGQVTGTPSDSPILFIKERTEGRPISIMACVQIVLILATILSIIICGTLYAYSIYLQSQIASKKSDLVSQDASLPDYPYANMLRLSKRAATLDVLLKNYISARSPLKFLENVVENQVFFDNFKLSRDRGGAYIVTFTAITTNYKTLIQQLGALNLTEYHKVIPKLKIGEPTESQFIKIDVATPVLVQGKLPDDVVFFVEDTKTKVASTTPGFSAVKPTEPALNSQVVASTTINKKP